MPKHWALLLNRQPARRHGDSEANTAGGSGVGPPCHGFIGYQHGCNKIHDWHLSGRPTACSYCIYQAFELMQLFAETSSEWCCWECLTKPGTIRAITGTLMHLKDAGRLTSSVLRSWDHFLSRTAHHRPCIGKHLRPWKGATTDLA